MNPRLRVLPIPVALILALATWGYSRAANRINPVQEGKYGTDYIFRAATALVGLGASLPQDAIYPLATTDGNGQRLDGANMYVLHFKKGKLPPVNGFWSLSMNDAEYFFVENALNRYTLSERNTLISTLTVPWISIFSTNPAIKKLQANWLPAPEDNFALILRMYWPKEALLNGSWESPGVL